MEKLKSILAEALMIEVDEVNDDLDFRSHQNWDSLGTLTVIASISDDFGIDISDQELKSVQTVGQLFLLLEEKKKK